MNENRVGSVELIEGVPKLQATQIFAFQNDRGKDLTALEKIKAYLMQQVYSVSPSQQKSEDEIRNLEGLFADIYQRAERIKHYGEDQVLGHHCIAYLPAGSSSIEMVKSALKQVDKPSRLDWICLFAINLKESFLAMEEIERLSLQNCSIADCLLLSPASVIPLLLKLFRYTTGETEIKIERINSICAHVERVLFRLEYTNADYRTDAFPSLARGYSGQYEDLTTRIRETAKRGFQTWWDFEGACREYFKGTYHYSSKIKYVLWKYENRLRERKRMHPISPADFQNKYGRENLENTIDHITPGKPSFTVYTDEFRQHWLHNIGNLTLMAWGDNSEKRNLNPVKEADMYDATAFVSHKEIRDLLLERQQWGENEIKTRRDALPKSSPKAQ